jgi:hypothetical protein
MIIFNASPGFGSPLTENQIINFLTKGKLNIHIGTLDNMGDDPNLPYKGVRGKGRVKIHENVNHNIPIAEKIMIKYLGNLEHPMAKALMTSVKSGDSVILEVSPNYYSTWDYSRQG